MGENQKGERVYVGLKECSENEIIAFKFSSFLYWCVTRAAYISVHLYTCDWGGGGNSSKKRERERASESAKGDDDVRPESEFAQWIKIWI